MMHRRHGGKRIRMDDEPPPEIQEHLAEIGVADDHDDHMEVGETSTGVGGTRMTRLRARGGVPLKAPIIDDDDDDIFFGTAMPKKIPVPKAPKQPKTPKQPRAPRIHREPRVPREREEREPATATDKEREITTDESSLFYIIRHSKSSISSIVDDWIDTYKGDRDSALNALMQFFINASGCKGKITPEMQASMEHTAIIRKMTEEFDEESGEYPLIMPGIWKKFKTNFCDFVQNLVRKCQNEIIYDQFLMDNVISLLTGLSDSQVRAFRHTATLAAMKLMTALVDVALMVSIHFDNTTRQYEAERSKGRNERASDRLESLMQRRSELEENMDEIKNMLTYMFKSVFVHRYRDTLPDIRAICMSEIGIWMEKFSQNFLDDSYLKYIGWTLHDKVGDVRLRCLQALLPLYENEQLKGKLELFTSKFKDRIVAMTLDKEFEVAVHAVRLVLNILKIHQDILTDKDCEIVYELVYSSHRGVAQAAAEFLNFRLFAQDPDAVQGIKTRRGKQRLPNTPLIRDLVQFFIESELHEHGAYLVDSFMDSNPMIKDWECMTDLLLEEPGPNEEPLDDKQESSLIEIMVSAVRQSATGEPPVGRGSGRKMAMNTKDLKQVQDDKQKLTEHFIQYLPNLLEKYIADVDKLTNLIAIPQFFDLEIYTTTRQTSKLQELLEKIGQAMQRHHSTEVLETCAKTLGYLCTEGTGISTICDVARSNLIDTCVNKYKESIDDWRNLIEGEEIPDEEEKYNVVISLKRVAILFAAHDINAWNLFPSMFQDIEDSQGNFSPDRQFPEEALCYCIKACFFSINWALYYIENSCDSVSAPGFVSQLYEMLHKYIDMCNKLMTSDDAGTPVKEEAYISICDLMIVFSEQLETNANEHIRGLAFKPDEHQYGILNSFVQEHVFGVQQEEGHDETKIEELHKKRNFLASYCKLVIYNIIPTSAAADIFKHYLRFYNDYGDIIKTTLGKAREINKINCALTICLTLVNVFKEIQSITASNRISKNCQEFQDLKELAKRFALSFGLDQIKNREAIASLHRAGILFAVTYPSEQYEDPSSPPPCLLFLEILNEFTNKLLRQDKKVVLSFLDHRTGGGIPSSRSEDWAPLVQYRAALVHGEEGTTAPTSAKKNYSKRKRDEHSEDEEMHDMEHDMEQPQPGVI